MHMTGSRKRVCLVCLIVCVFLLFLGKEVRAMRVQTEAFGDQGTIPVRYCMPGAGGENVSLPLQWSGVPDGVKSFAVSVIDPHPVANNWVHWLVIDIPPDTRSLPEGASGSNMPGGAKELRNSFGKIGYGGPQPPKGTGEHPYVVTVYALDKKSLDLAAEADLEAFQQKFEGHVLDKAEVTGLFEQK